MKKRKPEQGDVFAVTLPDGRYGAVKVINTTKQSSLIMTTAYLDAAPPSLDDSKLNEILLQDRFSFEKSPAIIWHEGYPPENTIYIGQICLSKEERRRASSSFGGKWDDFTGTEAFLEWRWEHDRENFIKEIEELDTVEHESLLQKPKKMMNDSTFWELITMLDIENMDTEPAVHVLSKMSVKDIRQFEEALAFKLYLLDTKKHAENLGTYSYSEKSYFSPDVFLYIRCAAVALGRDTYERALHNPDCIPHEHSFEPLLELASDAYERRMNKEFDYEAGCDYETFSNIDGWK